MIASTMTAEDGQPTSPPPSLDHPTLGIPAELLRIIFIFAAISNGDNGRGPPPCTNISHVCRRWRAVALTSQELWSTCLPRQSTQWTTTCFSRTPSVLLDVLIGNGYLHDENYGEAALNILSQWPRVKSFRAGFARFFASHGGPLVEKSKAMVDTVFDTLKSANPDLEVLHFNFTIDAGISGHWTPVSIPSDLFSGQRPPYLREVEFANCGLPASPPTPIFGSSLCSLRLFNTRAWVDVDSMIQYLRAVPMLEKLVYRFSRSPDESFDCQPSRTHQPRAVPLPRLNTLSLGGFWTQNMTIFIYIAAPSQCHLEVLHCDWDYQVDDMPEDAALGLIALGAEAMKQHFMPATSQGVAFDSVLPLDFAIWAEADSADLIQDALLPHKLELAIPQTENRSIKRAVFDMILAQAALTKTKSLSFDAALSWLYPDCFDKYTEVRSIILSGHENTESFIGVIKLKGTTIFPMLSRVVLKHFYVEDLGLDLLRKLAKALQNAHATTPEFERIVLDDCHYVTDDIVEELRGQLGTERVEWVRRNDLNEGQSP
ncbi:hypothetical protein PENSPDRAFT_752418 [Peniophora sp. CONT]|nr:hypothetical protein PENSPDRAFT_752418 [Peniophora sp. CONT]